MDTPIIVGFVVLAVLLFWVLGAYNRLVELRNTTANAWTQAAETLRRRGDALLGLAQALRDPLAAESSALEAMLAAHENAERAAGQMSARPLRAANAAAWVDAEKRLGAAAARVFALLDAAGPAAESEGVTSASAQWRDSTQRLTYTRQSFNDAAAAHDEALRAFPTSLLVRLFGFAPAGRI